MGYFANIPNNIYCQRELGFSTKIDFKHCGNKGHFGAYFEHSSWEKSHSTEYFWYFGVFCHSFSLKVRKTENGSRKPGDWKNGARYFFLCRPRLAPNWSRPCRQILLHDFRQIVQHVMTFGFGVFAVILAIYIYCLGYLGNIPLKSILFYLSYLVSYCIIRS